MPFDSRCNNRTARVWPKLVLNRRFTRRLIRADHLSRAALDVPPSAAAVGADPLHTHVLSCVRAKCPHAYACEHAGMRVPSHVQEVGQQAECSQCRCQHQRAAPRRGCTRSMHACNMHICVRMRVRQGTRVARAASQMPRHGSCTRRCVCVCVCGGGGTQSGTLARWLHSVARRRVAPLSGMRRVAIVGSGSNLRGDR